MARTIPAPPYVAPESTFASPGRAILAGSSSITGHWLDIVGASNLATADGHAAVCVHQNWIDVGAGFSSPAAWAEKLRYRFPECSKYHTTVRCRVYGNSASTTGQVRFNTGAATATKTLNSATDQWWTMTTSLTIAPAGGYEEVYFEVFDDVDIRALVIDYLVADAGAAWPGADGALAAGVVAGSSIIPLDTLDVGADAPHSSDLAHMLAANLTAFKARQRSYFQWSTDAAGAMAQYAHRSFVPVHHRAVVEGEAITVHVRATNGAVTDGYLYIQHGGQSKGALHPDDPDATTPGEPTVGNHVSRITVPALTGLAWYTATVPMRESPSGWDLPGLAALMHFGVLPWGCDVHTVSAWGP